MPNDEDEQLRLQILHQVYLSMLESKLTTAPLHRPLKILDVGTGTGEWAIGMAEHFPAADVTGIDLSAIQPTAVPPNVFFEIFDAEDDDVWTYPEDYFDLIHFRNMAGSFRSWDLMYERAYRHLKPGGWVEVVDFDDQEQCFFRFLGENSRAKEWYESITKASGQAGKEWSFTHLSTEKLARVGFQELDRTRHEVPIGTWPTDPKVRDIAKLWLVACLAGFEAYSLRLLTRDLGWSAQRVHQICQEIEKELKSFAMDKEKAKGMGIAITILLGQKPSAAWAGEMDMEADDERRSSKRVRTGAPSRDEKETPRAGDDADLRASQDMMQEMRRLLRRSGVSRSRMEQATNGAGAIPRGAGGDVDMGP
jgi:SAM-dependent methyltransferase